jgi:hypothetical protein
MPSRLSLFVPLLLVAACDESMNDTSSAAPELVTQGEMPAFCRGAAAEEFGQRPNDITTLPAEPDQGMFTVYGQYPAENPDNFFTCTFTEEGRLVGVDRS